MLNCHNVMLLSYCLQESFQTFLKWDRKSKPITEHNGWHIFRTLKGAENTIHGCQPLVLEHVQGLLL